jgi:hypothetical protein
MHTKNHKKLMVPPSTEQITRLRFRSHVREDSRRMKRRAGRRLLAAGATGLAIGAAARLGGPRAAQFFGNVSRHAMSGVEKQGTKLVKGIIRSKIPFFRRKAGLAADINNSKEALAIGSIQAVMGETAKSAAMKAHKNAFAIGAGAGATHFAGGSVRDIRKTRRDQGRLARRLLLM